MNNPLMYNDPDGEFLMWFAGALVGGYLNGVQANGSWNPTKWNWEKTWSAVLGGAIGGAAISGALGNITSNPGAIKSFLPGIVSGGLSSAFNGSNFLGGAIGGISYSGNLFTNKVTSTNMADAGYRYIANPGENSDNWIAPFGKKFKTIENVLEGDKFESYANNGNVCFRAAKAQTINGGGNPSGPLQALHTLIDNPYQATHGGDQLKLSYVAAIKTLMNELNNSKPITIGVTYARNEVGNHNRITDHFITVVGMGYDSNINRNFFSFYDNVGNTTNLKTNRLYVYPDRSVRGQGYSNNVYDMTEVRPNMAKPIYFNSNNIHYYKQYP